MMNGIAAHWCPIVESAGTNLIEFTDATQESSDTRFLVTHCPNLTIFRLNGFFGADSHGVLKAIGQLSSLTHLQITMNQTLDDKVWMGLTSLSATLKHFTLDSSKLSETLPLSAHELINYFIASGCLQTVNNRPVDQWKEMTRPLVAFDVHDAD
jgi:hypothetical protein